MPNQPAFDWPQAASLLGDDPQQVSPDMVEIVGELIDSANVHFKELESINPETDRKAIGSLAHQLRGSLLNFGFTEVGTLLLHIEKGEFTPVQYPKLIADAEKVFVESQKMLGERYPSLRLA